jgi:DNA mismatch repair protein MutS
MSEKTDEKYTPSMKQYFGIKAKYPDSILFFRMGDFYEMFGPDAEEASSILNIALTSREKGSENPVPMCGVPFHSATPYLKKLLDAGRKVAVCEQIGDPKKAKGIVERQVVRVLTPGTLLEDEFLAEGERNYLGSITIFEGKIGISFVELSMGAFLATSIEDSPVGRQFAIDEMRRFNAKEILLEAKIGTEWLKCLDIPIEQVRYNIGDEFLATEELKSCLFLKDIKTHEIASQPASMMASWQIVKFLKVSNPEAIKTIRRLIVYSSDEFLTLDDFTLKNLEIVANMRSGGREHTLMWVLDRTLTPVGKRTLAEWLIHPLTDKSRVIHRHEAVDELKKQSLIRESLRNSLRGICDISRLTGRIASAIALPRDVVALRNSLARIPSIKELLNRLESMELKLVDAQIPDMKWVLDLINEAICIDPSQSVSPSIFNRGYSRELDEYYKLATDSRGLLIEIQERERKETGIVKLKVSYNNVHGYYIEIPKSQEANAPDRYFRKQTLVNAERYVTQELKDLESKILTAEERSNELAKELWNKLLGNICLHVESLFCLGRGIGELDCLISLAQAAAEENYVRAEISDEPLIRMTECRHPVLEKVMGRDSFVPNDADFNRPDAQMNILTGPNMAGKSTYMRQIALAIIMNQVGGFVPAKSAKLGIFDRIFTRVGATDDLALGQSTFMVEMTQTAQILTSATPRSFIILDEIGRGTSTFDGLALAWSIAEYIHNSPTLGSITIFATHYHQLTRLSEFLPRVKNLRVMLKEEGGDIIFLRKVVAGRAQKSYGIQVARLAGLPDEILSRAREIFSAIEKERFEVNIIGRSNEDTSLFNIPSKDDKSEQQNLFGE